MISTRKLVVMALGLSALVVACEETTQPPPPGQPPQLETSVVYANTHDEKTGVPNGLASNDVFAFLTVSNGEFWVGTSAGVTRFASINANTRGKDDVVNEVNGLPHPYVKSMAELDDKVYVGTWGGGLGVYDITGDQWTQIRPGATGLTDGYVAEVATSATEDKLYMATNDGVFIYAPATSSWEHFSTVNTDPSAPDYADPAAATYFETVRLQSKVSALEITDDAGIVQRWYGPRVEIRVDDPGLFGITVAKDASAVYKYSPVNSGLLDSNVNDIYYDAVRKTYFVCYVESGISEVNVQGKTWTSYTLVQGLPSNTVYSIVRAGDGGSGGSTTMWAATQGGLAKLVGSNWQPYGRSGGLPADRARRVYSDNGHHLWVGFVDSGAARIKI